MSTSRVSAVVPTLGASPLLLRCLDALRADGRGRTEIVVVCPRRSGLSLPDGAADTWVETGDPLGFAEATNRGIAAARGGWIATVNDDLVIIPGWTASLVKALETRPGAAAAQGVNLEIDEPERTDGYGLAWNHRFQAVQLGRGERPPPATAPILDVYGVSATAALYRREALDAVRLAHDPAGDIFDTRLGSYYEDVDLACRLRAAGWTALSVPAARALHAGSATGKQRDVRRIAWIYGNRHLVLARHLGRDYLRRLPALLARDAADWLRAPFDEPARLAGIPAGWFRAARHLRAFLDRGRPEAEELTVEEPPVEEPPVEGPAAEGPTRGKR